MILIPCAGRNGVLTMASEAQKEPTMEEILASIRRIISEDDGANAAPKVGVAGRAPSPSEILGRGPDHTAFDDENDDLAPAADAVPEPDEIEADNLDSEDDLLAEFDLDGFDDVAEETAVTPVADEGEAEQDSFDIEEVDFDGDDLAAEENLDDVLASLTQPAVEDETREAVEAAFTNAVADASAEPVPPVTAAPQKEMPKMSAAAYRSDSLTDDSAANAAAGAMAKLLGRMEVSGDNTVEGMIREMLKPLLKEWLDANLPRIVEQKVEAEVQRIARMAG